MIGHRMKRGLLCLLVFSLGIPLPGLAGVWKRHRSDGTLEFTNLPPAGRGWRSQGEVPVKPATGAGDPGGAETAVAANPAPAPPTARGSGAFWYRERADGVMEFTNLHPVGAKWKVLFKTGPGKARALRGATDRVPARDNSPARFTRYDQHIHDQQGHYGIPPALVRAVIKTESDYDPNVVSSVGAMGLMQLMPGTARAMGVTDPFDPRQNIMGGARYLQVLARQFCHTPAGTSDDGGDIWHCSPDEHVKVISGYHAGPGAVRKYGGMPPYQTTRSYVANVLARFERYQALERSETLAERGPL